MTTTSPPSTAGAPSVPFALTNAKIIATITLGDLSHIYDGTTKPVTSTTSPLGLTVVVTYTGTSGTTYPASQTAPANAGTYQVDAAINDAIYGGTQSGTLVIGKAPATITLGNLSQIYDGTTKPITSTTSPLDLTVVVTYTGTSGTTYAASQTAPTNGGTYQVDAAINDTNYQGSATSTLTVNKASTTSITTEIHDASETVITAAASGSSVHDKATVAGSFGMPTGAVDFAVYANLNCDNPGTAAGTVLLDGSGVAHPSDSATVTSSGLSFKAHYNGDTNYNAADSACEPLRILCTSTGSTDWSSTSTWSCGHVPVDPDQVVIASGHIVVLSADVTHNGPITLDGNLDTGASILTLGPSATLSGSGEVIGTVRRAGPAAGAALFFNNVPTTLNFTTAPTEMDVKLTKAAHPNANAAGGGAWMLARYYTLTPTGSVDATVCLGYQDGELGTIAEDQLRLCRWDTGAGQWSCLTRSASSSTTNNTVCADDVTQFSDWTLGAVGPNAVTLREFRASAPTFDLGAWVADLLRRLGVTR